jgi:glycosyltransferase involved in cell wall biosynthesis
VHDKPTSVNPVEVLYVAAHAHFPDTEPLGGGKAVADFLCRKLPGWTVLSPRSLGMSLPKPLVEMRELEYARFCREFERAATAAILQYDPGRCVILANDISEGPNFRTLGERGYRMATIFHVDVVEYFTKFYLRNLLSPALLARFIWFQAMPDVLRLVFEKQHDCVRYSARLILPSEPMRTTLRRCYPWCREEKIVVLPWGDVALPAEPVSLDVAEDEFIIMTLSRLSPEKGIERLLEALPYLDGKKCRYHIFICGAPAYMKGHAYERKLRRIAARSPVPVTFTGHVTGGRKAALLQRADLFISPSFHESYGLTIAEAESAGCRVISHDHYGARGKIVDCSEPRNLAAAISNAASQGPLSHQRRSPITSLAVDAQIGALLNEIATH